MLYSREWDKLIAKRDEIRGVKTVQEVKPEKEIKPVVDRRAEILRMNISMDKKLALLDEYYKNNS